MTEKIKQHKIVFTMELSNISAERIYLTWSASHQILFLSIDSLKSILMQHGAKTIWSEESAHLEELDLKSARTIHNGDRHIPLYKFHNLYTYFRL